MTVPPTLGWWELPWAAVDPTNRPAPDRDALRARVLDVLRRADHRGDHWRTVLGGQLTAAVVEVAGAAAGGWRFGRFDGGPVESWSSDRVSLFPDGYEPARVDETAERVVMAVGEWCSFLDRLARPVRETVDRLAALETPVDAVQVLVDGMAAVIEEIRRATGRKDEGWISLAATALAWLLNATGLDLATATRLAGPVHYHLEYYESLGGARSVPGTSREVAMHDALIDAAVGALDPRSRSPSPGP